MKPNPIRSCEGEVHTDGEQIGRWKAHRDGDATSWMHGGFIISSGLHVLPSTYRIKHTYMYRSSASVLDRSNHA